jgi:hypothetical protein
VLAEHAAVHDHRANLLPVARFDAQLDAPSSSSSMSPGLTSDGRYS